MTEDQHKNSIKSEERLRNDTSLVISYKNLKKKYNEIEAELIFFRKLLKRDPYFRIIEWIFEEILKKVNNNQSPEIDVNKIEIPKRFGVTFGSIHSYFDEFIQDGYISIEDSDKGFLIKLLKKGAMELLPFFSGLHPLTQYVENFSGLGKIRLQKLEELEIDTLEEIRDIDINVVYEHIADRSLTKSKIESWKKIAADILKSEI